MTKEEYLSHLRYSLLALGISNVDGRIEYYEEMIDDRIEDGMTEEEAVASMESIDEIIEASRLERPVSVLVKEKVKKSHDRAKDNGLSALWLALVIIGFPLWFPVLLTVAILALTVFIVFWVIVFVFFVVEFALGVSAVAFAVAPFITTPGTVTIGTKLGITGAGLVLAGVVILLWHPLVAAAKKSVCIFYEMIKGIKKLIF